MRLIISQIWLQNWRRVKIWAVQPKKLTSILDKMFSYNESLLRPTSVHTCTGHDFLVLTNIFCLNDFQWTYSVLEWLLGHKSPNLSIHHHFLRSRFTPNTVMKSLKNSNINPENLENLALIIPRDSGLAQSREIRDPVTRLESLIRRATF